MSQALKSALNRLWRVALFGGIALGLGVALEQIPALAGNLTGIWQTIWTIVGGAILTALDKVRRDAQAAAEAKK
jgi:hypothetical protein